MSVDGDQAIFTYSRVSSIFSRLIKSTKKKKHILYRAGSMDCQTTIQCSGRIPTVRPKRANTEINPPLKYTPISDTRLLWFCVTRRLERRVAFMYSKIFFQMVGSSLKRLRNSACGCLEKKTNRYVEAASSEMATWRAREITWI